MTGGTGKSEGDTASRGVSCAPSLKAQDKTDEAERVQQRFEEAWGFADVQTPFPTSS